MQTTLEHINQSKTWSQNKVFIPPNLVVQKKLKIGATDDHFEAEADRVEDQIVAIPYSMPVLSPTSNPNATIQRKCTHCEEEEHIQKKALVSTITPLIQRAALANNTSTEASSEVTSKINSSRGSGSLMDTSTKGFMENRFGADFSRVRIHTDSNAIQLSKNLNAQAFTVGNDIYFNEGKYNLGSPKGKHLLAHELAHTIQQNGHDHLSRKLEVENPASHTMGSTTITNKDEVDHQIQLLNPHFKVNASGDVVTDSFSCPTSSIPPELRDQCLCEMVNTSTVWKIKVNNNDWPHTNRASHHVSIHNRFSNIEFGAWGGGTSAGSRIPQNLPRVLGHELCGHAHLFETGTHPARSPRISLAFGRPSHDTTVRIENQVADEIAGTNAPDRGLHADFHQGESFGKVTLFNYINGSSNISTAAHRSKISDMVTFLKRDSDLKVDIFGHSDSSGSRSGILRVSKRRARELRRLLIRKGVPRRQIKTVKGVGNSQCSASGVNANCRKVEAFMYIFNASRVP